MLICGFRLMIRFLLIKLQLDYVLSFREPAKRMRAFDILPNDLFEAYDTAMERIKSSRRGDEDLAMKIFSWISRTKRNLSMEELLEALAVEDAGPNDNIESILENKLTPADVIECCKSLITYDEFSGLVRFAHYTLQDFVVGHLQDRRPSARNLAKACLSYISFDVFDETSNGK